MTRDYLLLLIRLYWFLRITSFCFMTFHLTKKLKNPLDKYPKVKKLCLKSKRQKDKRERVRQADYLLNRSYMII